MLIAYLLNINKDAANGVDRASPCYYCVCVCVSDRIIICFSPSTDAALRRFSIVGECKIEATEKAANVQPPEAQQAFS